MAATEILRPQDCLINRFPFHPRRPTLYSHHTRSQPSKQQQQQIRHKTSPVRSSEQHKRKQQSDHTAKIPRRSSSEDLKSSNQNHQHKQQVTILKRGEPLTRPDIMYAGSAFSVSPAPESLPLPSFSVKKQQVSVVAVAVAVDASATRDLRRLLRLEC